MEKFLCFLTILIILRISLINAQTTSTACFDTDSSYCLQYAANGFCSYPLVQTACQISCKQCVPITTTVITTTVTTTTTLTTSSTANPCRDFNTTCPQSAAAGSCTNMLVQIFCPLSCKICSINATCKDYDSYACLQYANAGYCPLYTSVQINCPVSCNVCFIPVQQLTTIKPNKTCIDSDSVICPQYFAVGYCSLYQSVKDYCPYSCNLCTISLNTNASTTSTTKLPSSATMLPSSPTMFPPTASMLSTQLAGALQTSTTKRNTASFLKPFIIFSIQLIIISQSLKL